MYKIPPSAFESINDYGNDKEKSVLHVFTPMRISIGGRVFPHHPKKDHGVLRKFSKKDAVVNNPALIEFTDDEIKIHDEQGKVIRTEKIGTFDFVQFGALRTFMVFPAYTFAMTMVVGAHGQHYYVVNPNFTPFQLLTPILKQQSVAIEDPFKIAGLPSNEQREDYFGNAYEQKIKGTNYPLSLEWWPF